MTECDIQVYALAAALLATWAAVVCVVSCLHVCPPERDPTDYTSLSDAGSQDVRRAVRSEGWYYFSGSSDSIDSA